MAPLFRYVYFYQVCNSHHNYYIYLTHYTSQVFQPTYLSGHYAFVFLSDVIHPLKSPIDWNAWEQKDLECYYYNPGAHHSAFILPQFMKDVLQNRAILSEIPKENT